VSIYFLFVAGRIPEALVETQMSKFFECAVLMGEGTPRKLATAKQPQFPRIVTSLS
jgi:hypothetical protein